MTDSPTRQPLERGTLPTGEFARLSLQDKIAALHDMNGADTLRLILSDADPVLFVQSLPLLDLYRVVQEVGADNALVQLASPEQIRFILDLELWEEWSISAEKAAHWLETILETGDLHAVRLLANLDPEVLLIFLKKSMTVGGGLSDIINSEDHQGDWDHTFDEVFYLYFNDDDSRELILRMLELLYNEHHALYRSLMLGVENDLLSELEEIAWQFRCGRLEDEGLPGSATAATVLNSEEENRK